MLQTQIFLDLYYEDFKFEACIAGKIQFKNSAHTKRNSKNWVLVRATIEY